jgi:ribosomal-protein-alanine N-acetyltransferase
METKINNLRYETGTATYSDIHSHLKECSDDFNFPLEKRVDIALYSKKIFEKAITFEAWVDNILIGLIAAYFNSMNHSFGYITNISVMKIYTGLKIASLLMSMCIEYANRNNFRGVMLEVSKDDKNTINIYEEFGFVKNDIRGNSLLMSLRLDN